MHRYMYLAIIYFMVILSGCNSVNDDYEAEYQKLKDEISARGVTITELESEIDMLEEQLKEVNSSDESESAFTQFDVEREVDLRLDMLMSEIYKYTTLPEIRNTTNSGDSNKDSNAFDSVIDWYDNNIDSDIRRLIVVGPINNSEEKIFVEALEYRTFSSDESKGELATYSPIHSVIFEVIKTGNRWQIVKYIDEF